MKVGGEAENFNPGKKGDQVTFDNYESVAVNVQKFSGEPMAAETQSVTSAKSGERPGGIIETAEYLTAEVEDIDYQPRRISLKMAHSDTMSLRAGNQVKWLNKIKKGDEVVM